MELGPLPNTALRSLQLYVDGNASWKLFKASENPKSPKSNVSLCVEDAELELVCELPESL